MYMMMYVGGSREVCVVCVWCVVSGVCCCYIHVMYVHVYYKMISELLAYSTNNPFLLLAPPRTPSPDIIILIPAVSLGRTPLPSCLLPLLVPGRFNWWCVYSASCLPEADTDTVMMQLVA